MAQRIRILVAEDSPTVREFLVSLFNAAPDFEVVATASDGHEAVAAARSVRPDVVTMDVQMPRLDGLDATRQIMRDCPAPIVIVSSVLDSQISASFRALEAGALTCIRTPAGPGDPSYPRAAAELVRTVRLMAEIKVVRRYAGTRPAFAAGDTPKPAMQRRPTDIRVIAIGASTGGPTAIQAVLSALPKQGKAPVLIVQHIAAGFVDGFCRWLCDATGHVVQVARHSDPLLPGRIYIAPDDHHLGVDGQGRAMLSAAAPENGLRPAISYLFRTALAAHGAHAAAVLLSGMGRDGATEMRDLKMAGAPTFAQDEATAVVYGLPGEAVRVGAACQIMAPAQIGAALGALVAPSPG